MGTREGKGYRETKDSALVKCTVIGSTVSTLVFTNGIHTANE